MGKNIFMILPKSKYHTKRGWWRVVVKYPRVLMQKHISFYVLQEQKDGAERGSGRLSTSSLFQKLNSGFGKGTDWYSDKIIIISEVIKLRILLCPTWKSWLWSANPQTLRMTISACCWPCQATPAGTQSKPSLSLDQGLMQANPNDVPISKEISSESEHGKASQVGYQLLALCTFFCTYLQLQKYIKAKVTLKGLHYVSVPRVCLLKGQACCLWGAQAQESLTKSLWFFRFSHSYCPQPLWDRKLMSNASWLIGNYGG